MRRSVVYVLGLLWIGLLLSCEKDGQDTIIQLPDEPQDSVVTVLLNLPETPYLYSSRNLTEELMGVIERAQDNMPVDNPITDAGATLGRVLFYDKNLSLTRTVACASCHQQQWGFGDTAKFSRGIRGEVTPRHSMGLINARYYASGRFFWDERAETLEDQVLMPIQDPIEMDLSLSELVDRLNGLAYYPALFEEAFGDPVASEDRIAKALAQFVRSLTSTQSKYDLGLAQTGNPNTPFPNFTDEENLGKAIFRGSQGVNCAGCHHGSTFSGDNPRNNGTRSSDVGVFAVTGMFQDRGAFKPPSLKSTAVRPPYMHNGSQATLEDVIEHYNSELNNESGTLDPHFLDPQGMPKRMRLTEAEKQALLAFLHTLTDEELMTNPAFSDPFIR